MNSNFNVALFTKFDINMHFGASKVITGSNN